MTSAAPCRPVLYSLVFLPTVPHYIFFSIKVPLSCIQSMLPHTACLLIIILHLYIFFPPFPTNVFTVLTLKWIMLSKDLVALMIPVCAPPQSLMHTDIHTNMPKHVFSYTHTHIEMCRRGHKLNTCYLEIWNTFHLVRQSKDVVRRIKVSTPPRKENSNGNRFNSDNGNGLFYSD